MGNGPVSVDGWLARYAKGPSRLRAAIAGLDEQDLDAQPAEGGWSIRQIVHHIADGDGIWTVFIKMALGSGTVPFDLGWYWCQAQDVWAVCWNYARRPVGPSLALFEANRVHVIHLLQATPGAAERSLRILWPHDPEERVSIAWVVDMQTCHVEGHIQDIRAIRQAHGL